MEDTAKNWALLTTRNEMIAALEGSDSRLPISYQWDHDWMEAQFRIGWIPLLPHDSHSVSTLGTSSFDIVSSASKAVLAVFKDLSERNLTMGHIVDELYHMRALQEYQAEAEMCSKTSDSRSSSPLVFVKRKSINLLCQRHLNISSDRLDHPYGNASTEKDGPGSLRETKDPEADEMEEDLMEQPVLHEAESRCESPESVSDSDYKTSSDEELSEDVKSFFSSVSYKGFPSRTNVTPKAQPWRTYWSGLDKPGVPKDGSMIVACPRICTYGSGNLGGY